MFVPAFPGTNSEYDSVNAFIKAGANAKTLTFRNLNHTYIEESIEAFVKEINNSQILMFPGGFSAGDEPDGSGKFVANVLLNERMKAAVTIGGVEQPCYPEEGPHGTDASRSLPVKLTQRAPLLPSQK